jgi:CheY-like chemotaxis protein
MEIMPPETIAEEEEDGKEGETGLEAGYDLESEAGADKKNIILVVEDSADTRDYIRGSLEPLYTVMEAKDGREGIEKAREIIPDLIISDIVMPETDGFELCRILKGDVNTSHIPIVLLTAKASEESVVEGLETGADDYITKPFSTKILSARIKNLIDLRRQLQQTFSREMTLQPVKMEVSSIDKEFIKELNAAIEKNLPDPDFSVEEMCNRLYMGRSTLYRKIEALSGETPGDFIRSYRLKRGAELLKGGSVSVLEVAFEVGFSSATYFTKCFKKKFNQLPSEY